MQNLTPASYPSDSSQPRSNLSTSGSEKQDENISRPMTKKISCFDSYIKSEDRAPQINQQLLSLIEKKQFKQYIDEIESKKEEINEIQPFIFRKFIEYHSIELKKRDSSLKSEDKISHSDFLESQEFSFMSFYLMELLLSLDYQNFDEELIKTYLRSEQNECNIDSFYRQFVLNFDPKTTNSTDQLLKMRVFCFYSYIQTLLYYNNEKQLLKVLKEFTEKEKITQKTEEKEYLHNEVFETIHKILKKCILHKSLQKSIPSILSVFESLRMKPDQIYFNKLINFFCKNSQMHISQQIFDFMNSTEIKPTIVTYNTLIDQYFKCKKFDKAIEMFENLKKENRVQPDNFTLTTLINGLKNIPEKFPQVLELINQYTSEEKDSQEQVIINSILDACASQQNMNYSKNIQKIIDNILEKCQLDIISYNTLIKSCTKNTQNLKQAQKYFQKLKKSSILPNNITMNSLIDCCVKCQNLDLAWKYYDEMVQTYKIEPDSYTYSTIINGIKSLDDESEKSKNQLQKFFSIIKNNCKNVDLILYNTLIDACIKFQDFEKIFDIFNQIQTAGLQPNNITFSLLIKALGGMKNIDEAFKVFNDMKDKYEINDIIYGSLLDACIKNDRLDLALMLMNQMKEQNKQFNVIHYTTLIKGLGQSQKFQDAFTIFEIMKKDVNAKPNIVTYNSILDVAVQAQNEHMVEQLFKETKEQKIADIITYSTIIKYYGRKGDIPMFGVLAEEIVESNIKVDNRLMNYILETSFKYKKSKIGVILFDMFCKQNPDQIYSVQVYQTIMKLYATTRYFKHAKSLLDKLEKNMKVKLDINFYSQFVQVCINTNNFDQAIKVNDQITKNTQVSRDSMFFMKMVTGCLDQNNIELAAKFAKDSMRLYLKMIPDVYARVIQKMGQQQYKKDINQIKSFVKFHLNVDLSCHSQIVEEEQNDENQDKSNLLQENTTIQNQQVVFKVKGSQNMKISNTIIKSKKQTENTFLNNNNKSNLFNCQQQKQDYVQQSNNNKLNMLR